MFLMELMVLMGTDDVNPISWYGQSKLESERPCLELGKKSSGSNDVIMGTGSGLKTSFVEFVKKKPMARELRLLMTKLETQPMHPI